jgi:hypothetical protein
VRGCLSFLEIVALSRVIVAHSIRIGDSEGAKLIAFRVRTLGVPERELVDIEA